MARRSPHRAAYEAYRVIDEDRGNSKYLVTVASGATMLYQPDSNSVFEGDPDEDEKSICTVRESELTLDDGESVGDAVARTGDEEG